MVSDTLSVAGRSVVIHHADKRLFPSGETKRELAAYYERVAGAMLVHLADRPLNLERYPDGIAGERIIQQHAGEHLPAWIRRVEVPAREGTVEHVVAANPATLVYLADQACITFHRWLSRADEPDVPDLLVFDLDPSVPDPAQVRAAALSIGALLRELGLRPWAMTTGSRGYHVVVALQRSADFDTVREFARALARLAVAREPGRFTSEQHKAKREGKILIDIMRNSYAQTTVAPYAVRARPQAPVATPLHWEELDDPHTTPRGWTLASVPARLERDGDPWRDLHEAAQPLAHAWQALQGELGEHGG